jgi:double-strand break repair protein MRE11
MFRPSENTDEWFNLLVLHQNRVAHSIKNYLPVQYLDNVGEFLHLCLWGHEHECLINPVQEGRAGIHITQPGSSIATSLCEGEAVEKYFI